MFPHLAPATGPASALRPAPAELSSRELSELLEVLVARTGVDLAGQRRAMLARRAAHQLGFAGARSAAEYLQRVRSDPAEPWRLLERLTIKVSRFFRNPGAFVALRERALPELRRRRGASGLRVWCAGCANGQEAYSLAMLCAEEGGPFDVLGTDVDRAALARASAGEYVRAEVANVPPALAERHLVPRGPHAVAVGDPLARHVRFEAHDVASPAPPSTWGDASRPPNPPAHSGPASSGWACVRSPGGVAAFDLISCRNLLIYFVPERQREILARLAGRLAPGGILMLGEAEWPTPDVERRLEVLDRNHRIFRLPAGAGERSV